MEENLPNLLNAFPRIPLHYFEERVEEEDIYLVRDVYLRLREENARFFHQLDHIYYNPPPHRQMSMDPGV